MTTKSVKDTYIFYNNRRKVRSKIRSSRIWFTKSITYKIFSLIVFINILLSIVHGEKRTTTYLRVVEKASENPTLWKDFFHGFSEGQVKVALELVRINAPLLFNKGEQCLVSIRAGVVDESPNNRKNL